MAGAEEDDEFGDDDGQVTVGVREGAKGVNEAQRLQLKDLAGV